MSWMQEEEGVASSEGHELLESFRRDIVSCVGFIGDYIVAKQLADLGIEPKGFALEDAPRLIDHLTRAVEHFTGPSKARELGRAWRERTRRLLGASAEGYPAPPLGMEVRAQAAGSEAHPPRRSMYGAREPTHRSMEVGTPSPGPQRLG